jgi:hypothetical protein
MKRNFFLINLLIIVLGFTSCGTSKIRNIQKKEILETIDNNLVKASQQYLYLKNNTPDEKFPRTYDGKWVTSGSQWWCSGFYPGTLALLTSKNSDDELTQEMNEKLQLLEKEQFNTSTHDLGFMMYCSFGAIYKENPNTHYREILLNSAKSLASRFSPKVGCIRSWNSKAPDDFYVIIDNMMNLELLFWASKETGDSTYYDIAIEHANTTIKNHFRHDFSSYHLVNYNSETGKPKKKKTVQGAADDSAWARGQAWGLYGFSVMYRETNDPKYLKLANNIANFILTNPNLPEDFIPYWDFDASEIPDEPRDASAAAVIASALIELSTYANKDLSLKYMNAAEKILTSLSSPKYTAEVKTNGGYILKHSVGSKPGNSEVDVPLTYADYYFVEAMLRYKNLK